MKTAYKLLSLLPKETQDIVRPLLNSTIKRLTELLESYGETSVRSRNHSIPDAHAQLADVASLSTFTLAHTLVRKAYERETTNESEWRQACDVIFAWCQSKLSTGYDEEKYPASQCLYIDFR